MQIIHSKWFLSACFEVSVSFSVYKFKWKVFKTRPAEDRTTNHFGPEQNSNICVRSHMSKGYSHQAEVGKKAKRTSKKKERTSKKIFAFASAFIPCERTFIVVIVAMFTNIYCRNSAKVVSVIICYSNKSSIVVRGPDFRASLKAY